VKAKTDDSARESAFALAKELERAYYSVRKDPFRSQRVGGDSMLEGLFDKSLLKDGTGLWKPVPSLSSDLSMGNLPMLEFL
jgi:hypothetical protein